MSNGVAVMRARSPTKLINNKQGGRRRIPRRHEQSEENTHRHMISLALVYIRKQTTDNEYYDGGANVPQHGGSLSQLHHKSRLP
jgi:hypothetical protein